MEYANGIREWNAQIERSNRTCGLSAGALSMLSSRCCSSLPADLPASRTPRELLLRMRLARRLEPSRCCISNDGRPGTSRHIRWAPGRSETRAVPRLTLVVDVSGSVDAAQLACSTQEIEAITRRLEAALGPCG